jgi:hypothetical protein
MATSMKGNKIALIILFGQVLIAAGGCDLPASSFSCFVPHSLLWDFLNSMALHFLQQFLLININTIFQLLSIEFCQN